MKRMIMMLAVSCCLASPAWAAATPKTESIINGDAITLGDVFDGVEHRQENFYLAPAPQPGKNMVLSVHDLTRISRTLKLGWTANSLTQKTVIRRASNTINTGDIKEAIHEKLEQKVKSSNFELELADKDASLKIPYNLDNSLEVENLFYDASKQLFRATVFSPITPEEKLTVKGKLHHITTIPVLLNTLHRGDIITADDLDYIKVRLNDIGSSVIVKKEDLIGQTPKHSISAMKPLNITDIKPPKLVKKGDLVIVKLNNKFMSLSTQGRAMSNGSEGETIRVENLNSKQVISATVTGHKTVSVNSPLTTASN